MPSNKKLSNGVIRIEGENTFPWEGKIQKGGQFWATLKILLKILLFTMRTKRKHLQQETAPWERSQVDICVGGWSREDLQRPVAMPLWVDSEEYCESFQRA